MNPITYNYRLFKNFYPKELQLYTLIFTFHICRKTIFNSVNDGSAVGQLMLIVCVLLNFHIVYREKKHLKQALTNNRMYLAYYAFAIFTIFTSGVADSTTVILPKAFEVISSFMALSVVFWKINEKRWAMIYLLYLTTIATSAGYISYAINSGSLWAHTNTYSLTGAIGALLCLGMHRYEKDFIFKWLFAFNLVVMILGTSSASFIAFATGLLIFGSSSTKGISIFKTFLVLVVVILIYHYGMDLMYDIFFYGRSEEEIQSGTGRVNIWEACFAAWRQSPWVGQGYMVGERNLVMWGASIAAHSAHNGYISVLVNTGIVGCVIWGIYLLQTIKRCWNKLSSKYVGNEMTALFIVLCSILVNNYAYPCIGSDWNFTLMPVASIFILINTIQYKI